MTWKNFRLWTGFEPTTFPSPVQCSTNWAIKAMHMRAVVWVWPYMLTLLEKWPDESNPVQSLKVFQVNFPVVVWLHSHPSFFHYLIATVGHLLPWNLYTWAEYYVHWTYRAEPRQGRSHVALITQLVEHCTGNAKVVGSNPVQSLKFF